MRTAGVETPSGSARPEPAAARRAPRADSPPADVRKLQELVERQYRANRTLTDLLHRLAGEKAAARRVAVVPAVAVATLSQQPARKSRSVADPWWRSGSVAPGEPLWALAGNEFLSLGDRMEEVVGVTLRGLSGADLDKVVGLVVDEQRRERNFRPVFITDCPDFGPFIRRGYAFEYVSRYRGFMRSDEDVGEAEHIATATAKWGLERIIDRDDKRAAGRGHPALAAVIRHNADMSRACHRDRFAWMTEALRLALSGERYDAAEGLAEHLAGWFETLPPEAQAAAARVLCRKHVAFGEVERLRLFLFKHMALVRKDDFLFTLFSLHCTPPGTLSADFARLPGGKANAAYIARRVRAAGSEALPVLMAASDGGGAEANLLVANHFAAEGDSKLYRMFLNRYIARNGGASLARVSLGGGNVLDGMAFEPRPCGIEQRDRISVIMSAFDAAGTIGYAVRSILAQSYANLELLVCDDGSSDGTADVLARYSGDPRVRLFRSKGRQGTYNIRNALIGEATGRFVTFQDSDDLAFPDRLERQLAYLGRHNAAAVVARWFRVTAEGEILFSPDQNAARIAVVSLFAPKSVFARHGPYRAARFGADTEFFETLRMRLGIERVRLMEEPLLFGLSSEASLTRSRGMEASEDGYRAPARRAYAAAAARLRQTGAPADEERVGRVLADHDILMQPTGIEPLAGER